MANSDVDIVKDEKLSDIFSLLWDLDSNRCEPGVEYELNLQGSTRFGDKADNADLKLFAKFNEEKVFAKKTFKLFMDLLDNYEAEVGVEEVITDEELAENSDFLWACMDTDLMKEAHNFLIAEKLSPEDPAEFVQQLNDIWFKMYKRKKGGPYIQDSSSFEHVFVGETKEEEVIGLHNWIQFYLQEKAGNIDYQGYYRRGTSNEKSPRVISIRFTWSNGQGKPKGSCFIGVSPEFELALYTIAYLYSTTPKVIVRVADYDLEFLVHRIGKMLSTCYPQLIE